MNYAHLLIGCGLIWHMAAYGQQVSTKATPAVQKTKAEQLMDEYRFDDAIEQLQKDITTAKRRKQATEPLEELKNKAMTGERMLSATARVVFIDSMVVDKSQFLSKIRLSEDVGKLLDASTKALGKSGKQKYGKGLFINELDDKAYYSLTDTAGILKLHSNDKLGHTWSAPVPLHGISELSGNQDYPFMMTDGVTLYYASESEDGLGGYDLYVTRYNTDDGSYLKPENLGMPFNSPANDYLYAIDEVNHLGWLVTDRRQPSDKVCIYVFIPNDTRDVYTQEAYEEHELRDLARIASVSATQKGAAGLAEAQASLRKIRMSPQPTRETEQIRFIVGDGRIYTSVEQFKNPIARRKGAEWAIMNKHLHTTAQQLETLRKTYARSNEAQRKNLAPSILKLEKEVENLTNDNRELEAEIRSNELSKQ